jgi:hypothetical protein
MTEVVGSSPKLCTSLDRSGRASSVVRNAGEAQSVTAAFESPRGMYLA